jgi:hypothetical protein
MSIIFVFNRHEYKILNNYTIAYTLMYFRCPIQSNVIISTSLFSIFRYLDEMLKVPIFFLLYLYWIFLFISIFLFRYFQYLDEKFQHQQFFFHTIILCLSGLIFFVCSLQTCEKYKLDDNCCLLLLKLI